MSSSITRLISAKYLLQILHLYRMLINTIVMLTGFLLAAFAATYSQNITSFYMALAASMFFGVGTALGESTILGFCKGFPSIYVGLFSSGTGFAGIFGSGILLILKGNGFSTGTIFFGVAPFITLYFLSFYWLNKSKIRYPYLSTADSI
jgi:battenin